MTGNTPLLIVLVLLIHTWYIGIVFVPIAFVDRFQILWSNVVLYAITAEMSNRKMVWSL